MQPSPDTLQQLSGLLHSAALSPKMEERGGALHHLMQYKTQRGYTVCLLHIIAATQVSSTIRMLAATELKNYVKLEWNPPMRQSNLPGEDREVLKRDLVEVMISLPAGPIQDLVSTVVATIGQHDFYPQWQNLLPDLVKILINSKNIKEIYGVLHTVNSIFKRYRDGSLDALEDELLHIENVFGKPFVDLFDRLCKNISSVNPQAQPPQDFNILVNSFHMCIRIFYSLNRLELSDFFNSALKVIIPIFDFILTWRHQALEETYSTKPSVLTDIKTTVLKCCSILIQLYSEDMEPYAQKLTQSVLQVLYTASSSSSEDQLVSYGLSYITTIVKYRSMAPLVMQQQDLTSLITKLIFPNIHIRIEDQELFHESPEQYIRRDIEGSDNETRRRAAHDLLNALKKGDESGTVMNLLRQKLDEVISSQEWEKQDMAIYIFICIAILQETRASGVCEVHPQFNVLEYYDRFVSPILANPQPSHPILVADAIKFATIFRAQLSPNHISQLFKMLGDLIMHQNKIVHTYAAWSIERIIELKNPNTYQYRFGVQDLLQPAEMLLGRLFDGLHKHQHSHCNEHLMKTILTFAIRLKDAFERFVDRFIQPLAMMMEAVVKESTIPQFDHYLFDTIGCIIRYIPSRIQQFEQFILPICNRILHNNIRDFTPYALQLLGVMLESQPKNQQLPQHYFDVFGQIVKPHMYDNRSNIPGVVGYINSFLAYSPEMFFETSPKMLTDTLNIFSTLINNTTYDHEGFRVVNAIVQHVPFRFFESHFGNILTILFNRLQRRPGAKFLRCLIIFFSLFTVKHNAEILIQTIENIQPGLFNIISEKWVTNIDTVHGVKQRKICAIALIKLACGTPYVFRHMAVDLVWPHMIEFCVKIIDPEKLDPTAIYTSGVAASRTGEGFHELKGTSSASGGVSILDNFMDPKQFFFDQLKNLFSNPEVGQKAQALLERVNFAEQQKVKGLLNAPAPSNGLTR